MGRVSDTWAAVRRSTGIGKVIPIQTHDKAIPPAVQAVLKGRHPHSDFFFFDGTGALVARFLIAGGTKADPASSRDVANFAAGYRTAKAGLADWEKAKTPTAKAAALAKIAAAPLEAGNAVLKAAAEDASNPEPVRKAAVAGLARQQAGGPVLAGLLNDKNAAVRALAAKELKAQGLRGVFAVLGRLGAEEAEERAAAARVVVAVVRSPAARTVEFWRSGKPGDREASLKKLSDLLRAEMLAAAGIPKGAR